MTAPMNRASWEAAGRHRTLGGRRIFVLDRPATSGEGGPPLVVLHGFPSASFDWRHVLDALGERRRVVLLDFLGYGLSEKPDTAYSLFEQADLVEACATELGLGEIALLTHDMGDSVGGELLARELDGTSDLRVVERVLTNGSIYIGDAHLSDGQQLLLAMPDEILPDELAPDEETFAAGWAATFSPAHPATSEELAAQWELLSLNGGNRLLARLIRYIGERRAHERRWTGAIKNHGSPLRVVWGDLDPIAVFGMAERLCAATPSVEVVRLRGVGHYPMIEAPEDFADAVVAALA